jgi:CheY-like chemotaxis protein
MQQNYHIKPSKNCLSNLNSKIMDLKAMEKPKHVKIIPSTIKILLVEDDLICQLVQEKMLAYYGCQVEVVGTGEEAIAMFDNSYNALVLDINLPGISGLEVSKTIRSKNKKIPIIGLSSAADQMKEQCLRAGYSEVLTKPIGLKDLGETLKNYFPVIKVEANSN